MNETKVVDCIRQLQKAIECSICLGELRNPVETRCGHTFCGKCLQTALSKKPVLPCPLCKHPIRKRGIKDALYLSSIVDSVKTIKKVYNSNVCKVSPGDIIGSQSSQLSEVVLGKCEPILHEGEATLDLLDIVDNLEIKEPVLPAMRGQPSACDEAFRISENPHSINKEKKKNDLIFEKQKTSDVQRLNTNVRKCKQKNTKPKVKKTAAALPENQQKENMILHSESNSKLKNKVLNAKEKQIQGNKTSILLSDKNTTPHKEFSEITNKKRSNPNKASKSPKKSLKKRQSIKKVDSDCEDEVVPSRNVKQNAKEKVSTWLENVRPSLQASDEESEQFENDDFHDSEFDDLVSASQHDAQQNFEICRKRRHVINATILNDIKEKSARRDDEIFGVKSKQQYNPKHFSKEIKFYGVSSPNVQPSTKLLKKNTPKKLKPKKTKKRKSRNMFDLNGLSQGVSPFSSPNKDSEEKPCSSQEVVDSCANGDNMDSVETKLFSNYAPSQLSEQQQQLSVENKDDATDNSCQHSQEKVKNPPSRSDNDKAILDTPKGREVVSTEERGSETRSNISVQQLKSKATNNNDPASCENSSQDSKSTSCTDGHKFTTVTATVHSQPKTNSKSETPAFKTPVAKKIPCTKLTATGKSGYGLLRLEDMPIVCVAETQDDSEKLQPYFVETPAQSETTVLPKLKEVENNNVKDDRSTEANSKRRKPVELGLLDLSEPSQLPQDVQEANRESLRISSAAEMLENSSPIDSDSLPSPNKKASNPRRRKRLKHISRKNDIRNIENDKIKITEKSINETIAEQPVSLKNDVVASNLSSPDKCRAVGKAADDMCDSVPSNISSVGTNIIENTEEIEVARFKPNLIKHKYLSSRKETTENKKSHNFRGTNTAKLDAITETELLESPEGCNGLNLNATDIRNTSQNPTLPISSPQRPPTEINNQEQMPDLPTLPVHSFSTWPEAIPNNDSRFRSLTSCGLLHPADKDNQPSIKHIHKRTGSFESHCSDDALPDDNSVSSSPLLFAQSQSQIRSAVGNHPTVDQNGVLCGKCKHIETIDKFVQVNASSQIQQQPSALAKEITLVCEKLKQIFVKVGSRSAEVNEKIESLQDFLLQTVLNSDKCSNESVIKPSTRKRKRVLSSSSGSGIDPSPVQKDGHIIIHSDLSDVNDVEIENSLPDLNNKRTLNNKTTRSRASSDKENQDHYISDEMGSPKSCRKTPECIEVPATNDSDDSDVILATLRTTGRRKRVLSSSEEESSPKRQPKKIYKSNLASALVTNNKLSAHSNALFDAQEAEGTVTNKYINHKPLDNYAKTTPPASGSKFNELSESVNQPVKYDDAVNESPLLTESQVSPPTPPPPQQTSPIKSISGLDDLLKSISKLTKRRHSNDAVTCSQEGDIQPDKIENTDTSQNRQLPQDAKASDESVVKPNEQEDVNERNDSSQVLSSNVNLSNVSVGDSVCKTSTRKFGVMVSGLRGKGVGLVRLFAKKWGGDFYESYVAGKVTHAVVRTNNMRCDRTLKYLQAVASKAWVVSISWITHSLREKSLLPEERFEVIGDNLEMSDAFSFGPKRSRLCPIERKLLSAYVVYCIPPFALFTEAQYVELLRTCGATVVAKPEQLSLCRESKKKIITIDPDAYSDELPNYAELSEKYGAEAVSCSWALDCIATFNLQPTTNFPVEDFDSEVL